MFFNFFLLLCSSQLCDDSFLPLQETGALDLAKTFAEEHNCDIVLGNNPDADRLAVVEKDQSMWTSKIFLGDQIRTMLGLWIWKRIWKYSDEVSALCVSCCMVEQSIAGIGEYVVLVS